MLMHDHMEVATHIEGLYDAIIQPRVDGFLTSIDYDGGEKVSKGDKLFTIDPASLSTELYQARASLESARASEILAERNFERALPLADIDAISESDLDQYRARYKAAKANSASAEQALRNAEINMGYTEIFAPISGIASKTQASTGDYVGPTTAISELTTIEYTDTVTVNISIPSAIYLKHLSASDSESYNNANMLSNIELTLSDSTSYPHKGEYLYTKQDSPTASSSVVIVAKFANPTLLLKDGMFARVTCDIGQSRLCTVIPQEAVSQMQGINSVWVVDDNSTANYRVVELAKRQGGMWEVVKGVAPGEKVVTAGGLKLRNGEKVTLKK